MVVMWSGCSAAPETRGVVRYSTVSAVWHVVLEPMWTDRAHFKFRFPAGRAQARLEELTLAASASTGTPAMRDANA